jgi:hypothetical protein
MQQAAQQQHSQQTCHPPAMAGGAAAGGGHGCMEVDHLSQQLSVHMSLRDAGVCRGRTRDTGKRGSVHRDRRRRTWQHAQLGPVLQCCRGRQAGTTHPTCDCHHRPGLSYLQQRPMCVCCPAVPAVPCRVCPCRQHGSSACVVPVQRARQGPEAKQWALTMHGH